jgi:hypothetical protein
MVNEKGEYVSGWWKHVKRPYVIGNVVGPTKVAVKLEEGMERKKDWEDSWALMDLEKERTLL